MAGFELSSSRGGPSIWEVLKAAGFESKTPMKDFRAKMTKLDIPNDLGQKNSKALKWLNKNSKLKYVPLSDELLELEKSMGIHGSSKADKYFKRPERRIALSQRLFKIQEWAHEKFGKKTTMPKLEGIVNKLKDIPLIAKKGTGFLMKLGFRMTLGPSMIGADLMTEEAAGPIAEILSDKKEPLTYRGGGMANINTMTAPLGYKEGNKSGEVVGDREKKVGWAEPYSTEALDNLMRKLGRKIKDFAKYGWGDKEDYMEIGGRQVDPDDPNFRRFIENNYQASGESYIEGIENYRKAVEGEGFQRGGLAGINQITRPVHMAGGGLMGSLDPLVRGLMIHDILSDKIGKRPPISVIMDVDGYDDDQLIEAHKEYGGDRFK